MLVEVKQEDINGAERCNTTRCPIARALKRTLNATDASVRQVNFGVKVNGVVEFYQTSRRMRIFINKFDSGRGVQPFKFRLRKQNDR